MKKIFDNPIMYRLIALVFAILLFVYVNNNRMGIEMTKTNREEVAQTATKTQTITMPLQVSVNADQYFVTGYPEQVKVTLEGPSALVTSTINTKNFRVFIDLAKYRTGSHVVPVEVSGLNNQLRYTIKPKNVNVKIQDKKSKTFPIQIVFNKESVASGYKAGIAKAVPSVTSVSGPKAEVDLVDHVEARLNIPKNSEKTIEQEIMLVAVDKDGRQLNVVMTPATSHIVLPITLPSKKVSIKFVQKNGDSKKNYEITTKNDGVEIFGPKTIIDSIEEVPVDVDLTNYTTDFERTIEVKKPKDVLKINPANVQIKVSVTDKEEKGN